MDVQAIKLKFIEQYIKISDESIIVKLYQTLKEEMSKQNRLHLTAEERKSIDKGLDDIKHGRVLTGEEVKDRLKKKYPDLIK